MNFPFYDIVCSKLNSKGETVFVVKRVPIENCDVILTQMQPK